LDTGVLCPLRLTDVLAPETHPLFNGCQRGEFLAGERLAGKGHGLNPSRPGDMGAGKVIDARHRVDEPLHGTRVQPDPDSQVGW
jgi:hypothetical protein